MSGQGQLQTALESLAHAAQRLDAAAGIIVERQKETAELREKCERLQEALDKAEEKRDTAPPSADGGGDGRKRAHGKDGIGLEFAEDGACFADSLRLL